MMDKQALLKMIQDLPDDVEVMPISLNESSIQAGDWETTNRFSVQNLAVYKRVVHNELTLTLTFKTEFEGQFARTYTDQEGKFFNIRRVK